MEVDLGFLTKSSSSFPLRSSPSPDPGLRFSRHAFLISLSESFSIFSRFRAITLRAVARPRISPLRARPVTDPIVVAL